MYNFLTKTKFIGKTAVFLPSCDSTNSYAAEIAANNEVMDGTVFYTFCQTKGRGQRGNTWESADNENITMSVVLKPNFLHAQDQWYLSMAVAIAVAEAIQFFLKQKVLIKWPNDIFIENKKIAGLLIENNLLGSSINQAIVGIGVNVNQSIFENSTATSIAILSNETISIQKVIEKIFEQLEKYYQLLQTNKDLLFKTYYEKMLQYKTWATYYKGEETFNGKIIAVLPTGQLTMETEWGIKTFDFKEIKFIF